MSTTYNLTLTTAEACILKDFLQKHAPKRTDPSTISDDERAIAFIYDRIPDVTTGQQTFPSEQTVPTPKREIFRLCSDIIRTAPITKVEKYTGSFIFSYSIFDSENNSILYIGKSCGSAPLRGFYYTASLYCSKLHIGEEPIKELFNQIQTRYEEAENEQAEEERQNTHKILQDNIKKAKQYLINLYTNS